MDGHLNVICVFIIEIINRIKYEMEVFGSAVVLAVLFYSYPLQKDEVTNLSKDNVSSGRPFTIDSSALDET
jgi:hypothetical protein